MTAGVVTVLPWRRRSKRVRGVGVGIFSARGQNKHAAEARKVQVERRERQKSNSRAEDRVREVAGLLKIDTQHLWRSGSF